MQHEEDDHYTYSECCKAKSQSIVFAIQIRIWTIQTHQALGLVSSDRSSIKE